MYDMDEIEDLVEAAFSSTVEGVDGSRADDVLFERVLVLEQLRAVVEGARRDALAEIEARVRASGGDDASPDAPGLRGCDPAGRGRSLRRSLDLASVSVLPGRRTVTGGAVGPEAVLVGRTA